MTIPMVAAILLVISLLVDKQWGIGTKGTVTYPIAFTKNNAVVLGPWKDPDAAAVPYHGGRNITSFHLGTYEADWIAIGY